MDKLSSVKAQYRHMYTRTEVVPNINFSPTTSETLLDKIRQQIKDLPPLLDRKFVPVIGSSGVEDGSTIKVMQWNILAQSLSTGADNFIKCPDEALKWETRRLRILEEILLVDPDLLCLQEVDHFGFLFQALDSVGYEGHFVPKVDSPALYVEDTNGPDGCAIFFKKDKFSLAQLDDVILQADGELCNQVALVYTLKHKSLDKEFCIATTHLKAKYHWDKLRLQQGAYLLEYLKKYVGSKPVLICGDFNAEATEPVYSTFKDESGDLKLCSAYTELVQDGGLEPEYTTFKIRGGAKGEQIVKRTIDYIWYSAEKVGITSLYSIPTENEIGPGRLPSFRYPSDHFSLAAYLYLK